MYSFLPLFVFMGFVGVIFRLTPVSRAIAVVTASYMASHFLLFPSSQERFWGPVYIGAAMIITIAAGYRQPQQSDLGSDGERIVVPSDARAAE